MTPLYAELTAEHLWKAIKPEVVKLVIETARSQRELDAKFVYELDVSAEIKNPIARLLRDVPC